MSTATDERTAETSGQIPPVVMRFDPFNCGCFDTEQIFRNDIARNLYLLWRRGHIVSENFALRVREIAERIVCHEPKTVDDLVLMFPRGPMDFQRKDVEKFCEEFLGYFTGERPPVEYRVELSA